MQKSINHKTPYGDIEKIIENAIVELKKENLNAKITNVVFNIDEQLVLAQIYIERQNGFTPTKEEKFGTSPTCMQTYPHQQHDYYPMLAIINKLTRTN